MFHNVHVILHKVTLIINRSAFCKLPLLKKIRMNVLNSIMQMLIRFVLFLFLFLFFFFSDYKAILSKGKVRCAGSSLFLKNRFGIGYHLK